MGGPVLGLGSGSPVPLSMRVLVKGASETVFVGEQSGPRSDFNFGRVVEAELVRAGWPAQVRVDGVPSELARFGLRTWERDVLGWSPDVIVLHYGHYESIHYFLPRWLEYHANSWRWRPTRLSTIYRKRVLRPLWVSLAKLQQRLDGRFNALLFKRKLVRTADDVGRLITNVRTASSPLVLVLEVVPPGPAWRDWFPGLVDRTAFMNDKLAETVSRFACDEVRFVRTVPELTARLDPGEEPTPDGGHYSARAHGIVGEILAREILSWARTQTHLTWHGPELRATPHVKDAG